MLKLKDVKEAIDHMSFIERAELQSYLGEHQSTPVNLKAGTMDVDALLQAANEMREGVTDDEWDEIKEAMNAEYLEPINHDGFPRL